MTSARIGSARGEALRHVMYRFGVFCGALTEAWQAHLVTVCCTPPFTVLVERGRGRFHHFFLISSRLCGYFTHAQGRGGCLRGALRSHQVRFSAHAVLPSHANV